MITQNEINEARNRVKHAVSESLKMFADKSNVQCDGWAITPTPAYAEGDSSEEYELCPHYQYDGCPLCGEDGYEIYIGGTVKDCLEVARAVLGDEIADTIFYGKLLDTRAIPPVPVKVEQTIKEALDAAWMAAVAVLERDGADFDAGGCDVIHVNNAQQKITVGINVFASDCSEYEGSYRNNGKNGQN